MSGGCHDFWVLGCIGLCVTRKRHSSVWPRLVRVKSSYPRNYTYLDNSFTPSIVQGLGYSPTRTQLMTVPPFATAFVREFKPHAHIINRPEPHFDSNDVRCLRVWHL
ncbi:hypothetical protein BKA70DRAFT_772235 [Coprinopsis sp. MPI-PUGE-AT-0042]|nr:hypothetical protein BKA70DRAFT_772235 [Coprinopsis sp. MPI-PUGE-AT-0042]